MAHKVKAEGPGLDNGVELGRPTYFTIIVNTTASSKAKLDVQFTGPGRGDAVQDFEMIPHHDNTYTVKYTPIQQGYIRVSIMYAGEHIAKSPIMVIVSSTLELGKIKIFGLHDRAEAGKQQEFTIQSQGAGGQGRVAVRITGPPGKLVPCKVEQCPISDISLVKFTLPEEGRYEVDVAYDGVPVPGSPFPVEAIPASSPSKELDSPLTVQTPFRGCGNAGKPAGTLKTAGSDQSRQESRNRRQAGSGVPSCKQVIAYGAGLKSGIAGCPVSFTVDAKGAEQGGLCLSVEGPGAAKFECRQKSDSTWTVTYLPMRPGEFLITILLSDTHVPGSPFKAQVVHGCDHLK